MHPAPSSSSSAPAPPDPNAALAAHLDDVMAQAEIAANAERDLEDEAGTPTAVASARQEAPEPDDDDEEEDEADDDDSTPAEGAPDESEEEAEPESDEDEQPSAPPPTPPTPAAEAPRYSRRDAARFATENEQLKQQLQTAHAELTSHRGEVGHYRMSDQEIRNHLVQQSGYVREPNGRTRFENLSEKVLRGQASPMEAEEVANMTSWHEFAAPIYRAAQEMLAKSFAADWNKLRDLEGVGEDGLKRINSSASVVDSARAVHALGYAAGLKKQEAQLAKLRAEVKSLRTGQVARGPQPASANGAAVPTRGGFLQRAIDPRTGVTTDEIDREVAAGKWLGADLSKH
jgi:hypothetical protein